MLPQSFPTIHELALGVVENLVNLERVKVCVTAKIVWQNLRGEEVLSNATLFTGEFDIDEHSSEDIEDTLSNALNQIDATYQQESGLMLEHVEAYFLHLLRFNENPINNSRKAVQAAINNPRIKNYLLFHYFQVLYKNKNGFFPRSDMRVLKKYLIWLKLKHWETNALHLGNLANILRWASENNLFKLRIFSKRGKRIFCNFEIAPNTSEVNLIWNKATSQLLLIKNILTFFKNRKKDRKLKIQCEACDFVHRRNAGCPNLEKQPDQVAKVKIPRIQEGQYQLVSYCDFEAIVREPHILSHYALCVFEKGECKTLRGGSLLREDGTFRSSEKLLRNFITTLYIVFAAYQEWDLDNMTIVYRSCVCCKKLANCVLFKSLYKNNWQKWLCKKCIRFEREVMPVIFHNFIGYDMVFLMKMLMKEFKVRVAAKSITKIINLSVYKPENPYINFMFRDSLSYLFGSIAAWSGQLTEQDWQQLPQQRLKTIFNASKGGYPYEWLNTKEKLKEHLPELPAIWANKYNTRQLNREEILATYRAYNYPNCSTYILDYCKIDAFILGAYFQRFRTAVLELDKTDPLFFYSTPSYSWAVAVNNFPNDFHPPPTVELYRRIKEGIRGGVSQVSFRYFDVNIEQGRYFKILDVNTLYASCMTKKLPGALIETISYYIEPTAEPEDQVWFYCVDLTYPEELHDNVAHFYLPCAPHRYAEKLCTTFLDKDNYLVLGEHLQFLLEQGLKIKAFHHLFKWTAEMYFKDFVETNVRLRNESNDPNIKDTCKLKSNSLYGKTCENVYKYGDYRVYKQTANDDEHVMQNAFLANAEQFTIIDNETVFAKLHKHEILLNKPIQIGFTILEYAKLAIYKAWYAIANLFQDDVVLCYTDTDSLMLAFVRQERDPYLTMLEDQTCAALLDIPLLSDGSFGPPKKTLGLLSDDCGYKKIVKFIGLKSKMYSVMFEDESTKVRFKGIPKSALVVYNDQPLTSINFQHFYQALFDFREFYVKFLNFKKSKTFDISTSIMLKKALNSFDSKHKYTENLVIGYPIGYNDPTIEFLSYDELHDEILSQFNELEGDESDNSLA
uniref:DNA-directed DNA polymerase n=1 Tax=Ficedula parva densovirus TaxID=2794497 RepID=A0A8A4XEB9_9VIRU|nr:MAG: DNA polymerase B [Ficedula parva densovirus]